MPPNWFSRWFGRSSRNPLSGPALDTTVYKTIDLSEYKTETEAKTYVKFGKISEINEFPTVKREVFRRNIVVLDISLLKNDEIAMKRVLRELKTAAEDIDGDVAGLGEDYIVIMPKYMKMDRNKLFGEKK